MNYRYGAYTAFRFRQRGATLTTMRQLALLRLVFAVLLASALIPVARAQDQDQPATAEHNTSTTVAADRDVSWRQLPGNILHDQKSIWTFPAKVAHGKHLVPLFVVTGVTAALIAADSHEVPTLRRGLQLEDFNDAFGSRNASLGTFLFPASFYAVGLLRKDSYAQKTALLAGEALVDTQILVTVMKVASNRLRPNALTPQGDFDNTFFRGAFSSSSFPSGHTIAAFSVATIFARRYHTHRWVPWLAYGAAGLIGFSRVTLQAHFPSDVFLAAALGYSVSRFAVLGR
jgi:membrane-associated phospholipid phosphatase